MEYSETILAVDDTKENLDVLLDILGEFDVITLTGGEQVFDTIQHENVSVILLDIVMPGMDGYEVGRRLKADPKTRDIPIIFTTAKTDEESIAKAYESGASDYVSKPLKRSEVIARVQTQLKLKRTIEELEFLASRDTMTGVYNRRKFFELASTLFDTSVDDLYLAMIDIDWFKRINDTYGHDIGDLVIKNVAKTVAELLDNQAIFARIGGEEFVVLYHSGSKENVINLFTHINHSIASSNIYHEETAIRCTVSIGVCQKNDAISTVDEMLKLADLALYDAKNGGRNQVVWR